MWKRERERKGEKEIEREREREKARKREKRNIQKKEIIFHSSHSPSLLTISCAQGLDRRESLSPSLSHTLSHNLSFSLKVHSERTSVVWSGEGR